MRANAAKLPRPQTVEPRHNSIFYRDLRKGETQIVVILRQPTKTLRHAGQCRR